MSFKPVRNSISGQLDNAADIPAGTYSVDELSARNAARQAAMSKAIEADLQSFGASGSIGPDHESFFFRGLPEDNEALVGDAFSRMPKPSDSVAGSGDRYGKR